jgi:pyridoxamine 5'-phosphate oxidase
MTHRDAPNAQAAPPTPTHYENLDAVLVAARDMLADGAANRHAPAHTPTFATSGPDGTPRLRTVVLRDFTPADMQLRFHTDRRSGKITELQANPAAALHVYDRERKVQLQVSGRAALHMDDDVAAAAWAQSQPMSRICYQVTKAPGSVIEDPGHAVQDPEQNAAGSENFMAVILRIEALEWLFLDARGHRRARFARDGDTWPGVWLVP